MDPLAAVLDKWRKTTLLSVSKIGSIERYLSDGSPAALSDLASDTASSWVTRDLLLALGQVTSWTLQAHRVLNMAVVTDTGFYLTQFIDAALAREKPDEDALAPLCQAFEEVGKSRLALARFLMDGVDKLVSPHGPTSSGRFLIACSDQELHEALAPHKRGYGNSAFDSVPLVELFGEHTNGRLAPLVRAAFAYQLTVSGPVMAALLRIDRDAFESRVLTLIQAEANACSRFRLAENIYDVDPARYRLVASTAARAALATYEDDRWHGHIAEWLVNAVGPEAVPDITTLVSKMQSAGRPAALDAVGRLGKDAVPALLAGLHPVDGHPETIRKAAANLMALDDPAHDAAIEEALQSGLCEPNTSDVIATAGLAGRWKSAQAAELLWPLLAHKSRPVRESVARTLAKQGEAAIPRATALLSQRSVDVRSAAVTLLVAIGTEAALTSLQARLDQESSDDVRDQILLGLEEAWQRQGRKPTWAEIAARISRAAPRLAAPVATWLDESKLPPLLFTDGKPVDGTTVRYLLYRQSRTKDMRADVEAKPLYAHLDRRTSGPFALSVLEGFLASGADASDRWALATACLLGADSLVPRINAVIRDWVDSNRGKLAEYATQALALMGSDVALAAVDALAIRYRSKMKNVGRAAEEAFAAAAAAAGVDTDELGDRVVPWLGFSPDQPRVIEDGKLRVAVEISPEFKLRFTDLDKNKRLASLPKSTPKPVADEMKDLAAILRESAKAQILRMEGLLVRQRRWPASRWRELFREHPLLRPFSQRLVWGCYDQAGALSGTFRALEDGSLTTASDDSFDLPTEGLVGLVHPLELDTEIRTAWQRHFGDYETTPPFAQLDRAVFLVAQAERSRRVFEELRGLPLNAMTFKGRAERLGWRRGSVVDGGGVTCYRKSFLAAAVDVMLYLDGLFMGAGMDDQVTLEWACFVPSGSVKIGSYVYDDPGPDDPRLLTFGDVPAIVYSEAMGDLKTIAGKGLDAPEP